MTIAIYGRSLKKEDVDFCNSLLEKLKSRGHDVLIFENFYQHLNVRNYLTEEYATFKSHADLKKECSFLFSIGGDGTLLDTLGLVQDSNIPIMGINAGRLGFLSSTSKEEVNQAINAIEKSTYELDERSLLKISSNKPLFPNMPVALNEVTIQKRDPAQMAVIHAYVNGTFLNSYWADGLIISTPTGSTAYNLSCGGPIIDPKSTSFVITPVAAHNLNVRPFVIDDSSEIMLEIEGRSQQFACTLDSRTASIDSTYKISVKKEDYKINLLRLPQNDFLKAIRGKLNWGMDKRN